MILHVVLEKHDQQSDQFEKQTALEQRLHASLNSIVLNFVVNYPLVLCHLEQSHIEINNQIFHAFSFNIRNYSPEAINIQLCEAELNIILPRVNNFDIEQKRHQMFVLLYATNTKQDLGR